MDAPVDPLGSGSVPASVGTVFGRDHERRELAEFLAAPGPSGLLITGPAGIGKSALWEDALARAAGSGILVLAARPAEGEQGRAHAVLGDLLRAVDPERPARPAVRATLEAVLTRAIGPEPYQMDTAVRTVLEDLRAEHPVVLVAVDDAQWADAASVRVLTHAVHNRVGVHVLLARRTGCPGSSLEDRLARVRWRVLELGPLDPQVLTRLIADRLGLRLPRWVAAKLARHADGNPLFALEMAQVLRRRGLPRFGEPLDMPGADDLIDARIRDLPGEVSSVLLASELEPRLTDEDLVRLHGESALDAALRERVIVIDPDHGRARPEHPLIGAASRRAAAPTARRRTHRAIAARLAETRPELAIRHRGLGSSTPEEPLAAELAAEAAVARDRGDSETAVELAQLALDRTPAGAAGRGERVLALAEALALVGSVDQLRELIDVELSSLPPGDLRARAHLLGLEASVESTGGMLAMIDAALLEPGLSPAVRARALSVKASVLSVIRVERIAEALDLAEQAHALDPGSDGGLSWCRALRGQHVVSGAPETLIRHAWRGELEMSRELLEEEMLRAEEAGAHLLRHDLERLLVEVSLRAGDVLAASARLEAWLAGGEADLLESPEPDAFRARLAVLRGDLDAGLRAAARVAADADRIGSRWVAMDADVSVGIAASFAPEKVEAAARLSLVWEHCERVGVRDPGAFPVALDLLLTLVRERRFDTAHSVLESLSSRAEEQRHPWASAVACYGEALIELGGGPAAVEAVTDAALSAVGELTRLGARHDAGRALLGLGRELRRGRRWRLAHAMLRRAGTAFAGLGADGWVDRVRAELSALGGHRRPTAPEDPHGLTERESEVLGLLTEGLTNAEIAGRLHLSAKTVGHHVSAVLAKLGVGNRREAARMARSMRS